MLVNKTNRTQSVSDFRSALKGEQPGDKADPAVSELFFSDEAEAAEAEAQKKRKNRWRYLSLISVCLLFVMTAVYFVSAESAKKERERRRAEEQENLPETVNIEAPDYRGKKISETDLDTLSFDFVVIDTFSEGTEDGVIVNQDPYPGTEMGPKDRTITLFVNKTRSTTAIVPNLIGLYLPNAEQLLESLGIEYTVIFEEEEGKFPGLVYAQSIDEGEKILLTEPLTITVQPDPDDPDLQPSADTEETG